MSTGVDIPDLEFIVFLRAIKSRILFEQMLGCGTRKGEKFTDKSHFTVFDCFGGTLLEYFRQATAITAEPPEQTSRTIVEIIEDIWNNRDRDYNTRCLVKRLRRIEKEMSAEARDEFAAFIPEGDVGRFATELPRRLAQDFTETMKLLRDPRFQDLLTSITKKERPLAQEHFAEFEKRYGVDPNGKSKRRDTGAEGRFRKFHIGEIKGRDYKLDITWLKDESLEDADELPEPQDLASGAITELEAAVDDLKEIAALLEASVS